MRAHGQANGRSHAMSDVAAQSDTMAGRPPPHAQPDTTSRTDHQHEHEQQQHQPQQDIASSSSQNPSSSTVPVHSSDTSSSLDPPRNPSSSSGFVQPSSFLGVIQRENRTPSMPGPKRIETAAEREQLNGLRAIRRFLKTRTSYDVLPMSYRLIVFDTSLLVKKSLNILIQNGIVSAPLWDSRTSSFAGLLTTSDYINVVQYYWQHPEAMSRIDQFRLDSLRDIEKALGVAPLETISIHPLRPLYEACRSMATTRARRIPLIDVDDDTQRSTIVNVLTQYRILKFVAVNVTETQHLRMPLRQLPHVGTFERLETARMETAVIDVIHQLVRSNISSVPILNTDGIVVNVFEAVDVIHIIKGGVYDDLSLSVGEALQKRSPDFPGIYTCSLDDRLDSIFDTIRKSRVHRFVVLDEDNHLCGLLTLSDILEYILLEHEGDD